MNWRPSGRMTQERGHTLYEDSLVVKGSRSFREREQHTYFVTLSVEPGNNNSVFKVLLQRLENCTIQYYYKRESKKYKDPQPIDHLRSLLVRVMNLRDRTYGGTANRLKCCRNDIDARLAGLLVSCSSITSIRNYSLSGTKEYLSLIIERFWEEVHAKK